MKKLKSIYRSYFVVFFGFFLLFLLDASCMAAEKVTVTDFHGRFVTLKVPVERFVLLESSKTHEIAAILGDEFAGKIVGWDNDFKKNAGDAYAKFVEKFPQLNDIPDVGSMDGGTMSIEKVMTLRPDVVIAHEWQFMWGGDATKDAVARLDQAGIPILFVDYYMDPLRNSTKSTLLLGKIFGKEERAQALVDFYNKQADMVYSRLEKIKKPKPSVYVEVAYKGPAEYGISYGDVAWGSIIKKAGGDNIGEPVLVKKGKPLSPEYLIEKNPEIIILTGRNWKTPGSVKMGYLATEEAITRDSMAAYVGRLGWDVLKAVAQKKVFGIYHGFCYSIYNFIALQALAGWFYPEEFKDVDPTATLREYHKRFMPIEYNGNFVFSYFRP
jgi:iron complex transport system substrate-binding protein